MRLRQIGQVTISALHTWQMHTWWHGTKTRSRGLSIHKLQSHSSDKELFRTAYCRLMASRRYALKREYTFTAARAAPKPRLRDSQRTAFALQSSAMCVREMPKYKGSIRSPGATRTTASTDAPSDKTVSRISRRTITIGPRNFMATASTEETRILNILHRDNVGDSDFR